jgi:hypothetical protein
MGKQINKVFQQGYLLEGEVTSTIDFFDVEKGDAI